MKDFFEGFEKRAAEEPTWWEKQKGVHRAMRASDKGFRKVLASDELVGSRMKKSLSGAVVGGLGGAAAGGLGRAALGGRRGALMGALLGGGLGSLAGQAVGQYKADKEYLGKRGITPKYLGFSADFSPEAKKKYITDWRRKG